jgi:ferredoxin
VAQRRTFKHAGARNAADRARPRDPALPGRSYRRHAGDGHRSSSSTRAITPCCAGSGRLATTQSLLLLLVWTHGIIGLHFSLRARDSYQRWRDPFMLAAILIPVLALIGFAVAAREAAQMQCRPRAIPIAGRDVQPERDLGKGVSTAWSVASSASSAIREIRVRTTRQITVRFVGHGVRKLTPGLTVLEMFRRFGIPHAALCGGRARCATCRVLVLDGGDKLPPPGPNEAKLLRRISAPDGVRLACQIRPRHDLQVQILLASRLGATPRARTNRKPGRQARPDRHGGRSARLLGPVRAAIAAGADRPAEPLLRRDVAGDHRSWRPYRRLLWRRLHGGVRAGGHAGARRAGGDQRGRPTSCAPSRR